jgi:hypothetical protein
MKKIFFILISLNISMNLFAQGVDFELNNVNSSGRNRDCDLLFDITNKSDFNITAGSVKFTLREEDGSIIAVRSILFNRIKKNDTIAELIQVFDANCSIIKSIKVEMPIIQVDGAWQKQDVVTKLNLGRRSSRINGITVK